MIQAYRVNSKPIQREGKPVRDREYLAFVRSLPSAVSGRSRCEAAHTGPHGIGQKSSDLNCIPLTAIEHRQYGADPVAFCLKHGLDVPALIARLNAAYELKQAGRIA